MKERPILFSQPMVRAILEGLKTQTRRIVKPQPPCACHYVMNDNQTAACCFGDQSTRSNLWCVPPTPRSKDHRLPCPYGQPGDRLWVRERFRYHYDEENLWDCIQYADGSLLKPDGLDEIAGNKFSERCGIDSPWRPSIHMPRWASRITLEVTGIRVERLQAISDADAKAEGATSKAKKSPWGDDIGWSMDWSRLGKYDRFACTGITQVADICLNSPRWAFCNYINKINGEGTWDANPWVWVVEFRRLPNPAITWPAQRSLVMESNPAFGPALEAK